MQNIYDARQKGKLIFLLISVLLVGGVLYVSNDLVEKTCLSRSERKWKYGPKRRVNWPVTRLK